MWLFVYITNVLLVMLNIIPQKKLNSDGYQIVVQLQKYKKIILISLGKNKKKLKILLTLEVNIVVYILR